MAVGTFYVRPKGTATGDGSGSSSANAINGIAALNAKLANGSISGASTIKFDASQGPFGLADAADFPYTGSATAGLPNSSITGPTIGTAQGAGSLASGKTFLFSNETGWAYFDMRGGTTNAQRMRAALTFRGEDMLIDYPKVWAPNQNYLTMGIPYNGNADAETQSYENYALAVWGNGNTVQNGSLWGSDGFSRFALFMGISNAAVTGASANKTNVIQDCDVSGSCTGLGVEAFGSGGYDMCAGQVLDVRRNYAHGPCWGRRARDPAGPYNAARHGNAMTVAGKFFGRALLYNNEATGEWQDCFEFGIGSGLVCRGNYGHDLGTASAQTWRYNSTSLAWELGLQTFTEGNGIKCGLGGYDGTGPTTWLGTDGTAGGSFNLDEARNIIVGNKIYNAYGNGVTTNGCKGIFIHANEFLDTRSSGILLNNNDGSGNPFNGCYYVSNNVARIHSSAASFTSAIRLQSAIRVHLYNNIFWTDSTKNHRDVDWSSGITVLGKNKNLLVTGRTQGTGTYPTTGDLPTGVPSYTAGVGLTVGSPLIGAGEPAHFTRCRTYYGTRSLSGSRLNLTTPNIGPI